MPMNGAMKVTPTAEGRAIERYLDILRCPITGEPLVLSAEMLVSQDQTHRYPLSPAGIPLFAGELLSPAAQTQRAHYNKIAAAYTANLSYPHTREYMAYLDAELHAAVGGGELGTVVELCCGHGEALRRFGRQAQRYVGIDVSENMLHAALAAHDHSNALLVQADATRLPLANCSADTVVMLGGVHHVPARARLFREIARILKPGGRFIYREPVSDFVLWRALRAVVYRLSPMLDEATERPLLYRETVPLLEQAGLRSLHYQTHGLIGFCLFMNSDVLFINRLFRFVPGIRWITRLSARVDRAILALPRIGRAGLLVVGIAQKPAGAGTGPS